MGKSINLIHQTFGRLIVIAYMGKDKYNNTMWLCRCECNNETILRGAILRCGHTRSCGCLARDQTIIRNTKHGYYNTKTYNSWRCMIKRCYDVNNPSYKNYGGRGIRVCKIWMKFEGFLQDMGERPPEKTLDRIDNNKNYILDNCQWATNQEQCNNKTNTLYFKWKNKRQSVKNWCRELKREPQKVYKRIQNGWTIEEALGLTKRKKV